MHDALTLLNEFDQDHVEVRKTCPQISDGGQIDRGILADGGMGASARLNPDDPICVGCMRRPGAIPEYVDAAKAETLGPDLQPLKKPYTPTSFVKENEGTFNHRNGHFYCTDCYISAYNHTS